MVIFLLLFFLFLLVLFLFHNFMFVANLPPGPTLWQLWRRRHAFATKPHVAMRELANTYGPLLSFRLGSHLVVVASSPAAAEEILKTNNLVFSGRFMPSVNYDVPGTTNAVLTAARECDASWKFLRTIGHQFVFSTKAVESAASIRKAKVKETIEFLRGSAGRAAAVDVEHVLRTLFTNIIANVLASRDLFDAGGESEGDRKMARFVNDVVKKATSPRLSDVFPNLRGIDFWRRGKGMEVYEGIQLVWGDIVRERRRGANNLESKQDFLDVLNGYSFDHDQICNILMELLLAATDSTTVTAVWLMAELIKNEEILHKVGNEIAVEGDDELNESWLSECSYFEACIKETLRLHIPGPFAVPHRAIESCKVSNYMIPRDSIVVVNVWAIHMDPKVWDDAAVFKPERFLDSKTDFKGAHFEYLPFSAGKRMCPGFNVAVKVVMFVVASLLYHFDWSLPQGENPNELDMSDKFKTTIKLEKPLYTTTKRPFRGDKLSSLIVKCRHKSIFRDNISSQICRLLKFVPNNPSNIFCDDIVVPKEFGFL